MSELNRKLAEALGFYRHECADTRLVWRLEIPGGSEEYVSLPAFDTNPGVFWPAFEKWCDTEYLYAHVRHRDGRHIFTIGDDATANALWKGQGESATEAGCSAWLQAIEALKNHG